MLVCGMHALAAEFTTGASAEGRLNAQPSHCLQYCSITGERGRDVSRPGLPSAGRLHPKRKASLLPMRTLAMSGWRGLSRTLLSTGTTTEAQVIRQLQPAVWQQVPRLHLPIEIDHGQGVAF